MAAPVSRLTQIKHKIVVLSGKGGVGKSTVSSQLALSLVDQGFTVGLLDIDLSGPSIPKMLNVDSQSVHNSSDGGWIPVYADKDKRLSVMSVGFILADKDSAVILRGPKKSAMIKQFIEEVKWGPLDFLVIDTPPGTSDEHITVCELLLPHQPDGAIIVTTPQNVSIADVRKEISFCKTIGLPILGIVENMSGFICPCCGDKTNIFSSGGGEVLANELRLRFLGRIPIDPQIAACCEAGQSFVETNRASKSLDVLRAYAQEFKYLATNTNA